MRSSGLVWAPRVGRSQGIAAIPCRALLVSGRDPSFFTRGSYADKCYFCLGESSMIPVISNHFCLKQNDLLVGFLRFLVDKSFSSLDRGPISGDMPEKSPFFRQSDPEEVLFSWQTDTPINVIFPPGLTPRNVIFGCYYADNCYFGRR